MIPKSGYRFSDKIMRKRQKAKRERARKPSDSGLK
jgi:hypothetical protein